MEETIIRKNVCCPVLREYGESENLFTITDQDTLLLLARIPKIQGRKSRMEEILAYIDRNLGGRITLETVGKHCGISASAVAQLFRRESDMTFHVYLTSRRMYVARELIQHGIPLEQIGKQVGYPTYSSFFRAFRSTYGCSPQVYRMQR